MNYDELVNQQGELKLDSPKINELIAPLQAFLNSELNLSEQERRAFQSAFLKTINDIFSKPNFEWPIPSENTPESIQNQISFQSLLEEIEKELYNNTNIHLKKLRGHY